jgi:histidinol-phosphate/aromatic aminotransferase/cobyric acid decarboxylase-like protein
MNPLRHVKPAVRSLQAYTLAKREATVKINQNENPHDLPDRLKKRVVERALARPWSRYPDFDARNLRGALARYSGWRPDGILAGNGSNEMIEALLLVTVAPGTRVVIPEPTFTLYAHLTTILGGEAVRVPMRRAGPADASPLGERTTREEGAAAATWAASLPGVPARAPNGSVSRAGSGTMPPIRSRGQSPEKSRSRDKGTAGPAASPRDVVDSALGMTGPFVYDAAALLEARREGSAAVTIVCSPNNPTGTSLPLADVERLCADGDGLVVIDEAYHEFAGETAVPLLARHPNLVVLRTFSKAMALAGLRIGYLLASPELVREIDKARLPYNLNFFSQMAALAAIEDQAELDRTVRHLVEARDRLLARLADVPGVRAWPSRANFFLLELLSADPKAVFESLCRRGVLVRDVTSYPMLDRCLRVSVGTDEENEAFLRALGTALGETGMDLARGRA